MKNATRAAVVAVLAVVASLLIAPSGTAQASSRAAVGTISGTVTGPAPATVTLHRRSATGGWSEVGAVEADLRGAYTVRVPSAGTYHVRARLNIDLTHAAAPSRSIAIANGTKVTGVDLAMAPNPTVDGVVTASGFDRAELRPDLSEGRAGLRAAVWGLLDGHWERFGGTYGTYGSSTVRGLYLGPWVDLDTQSGAYTVPVPGYFDAIRLQFYQPHCVEPVDCGDYFGATPVALRAFWNGTPSGAANLAAAADIDVSAGSVVDKNITLQAAPRLRATARPTITGVAAPGKVLTARVGSHVPTATGATYTWRSSAVGQEGEQDEVVGHGRTFTVPPSLVHQKLLVHVTASRAGHEAPLLASTYVMVKTSSKLAVKAKPGKRKATVTIAIKAPGVATSRIHGKASIYAKGKRIKTVNVRNGKATFTIAKQKKGKRTYTVRYSGNRIITSSAKSLKIAIR
ncbi:hypothetical protein [Aeromicrobium tamlense]|uniref:Bacterial Ig-like domain-containing protein n=2 Tax=Aeromicrobium tamlense TaxID=375541 RepID=A0ABX2SJG3_9ACTN|nr:hypothetical protein [Aeromicrobium tamlense]NYI39044.1 hypothetical protein [Aeromicrobium tamlense]